jgi:hypothetical protein
MSGPIDEVIGQWITDGVIMRAPVGTTFNTPIFAVSKKDLHGQKRYRVCADFRPLNALLPDDTFPLPRISDIFKALAGAVIFTTLDLKAAYNRFLIAPEDRHKTCFTWQDMQYVFARAPFGLKTLPSIFQRVIQIIIADIPFARAYIDDVIVFSQNLDEHADHVRQVVQALTTVVRTPHVSPTETLLTLSLSPSAYQRLARQLADQTGYSKTCLPSLI